MYDFIWEDLKGLEPFSLLEFSLCFLHWSFRGFKYSRTSWSLQGSLKMHASGIWLRSTELAVAGMVPAGLSVWELLG